MLIKYLISFLLDFCSLSEVSPGNGAVGLFPNKPFRVVESPDTMLDGGAGLEAGTFDLFSSFTPPRPVLVYAPGTRGLIFKPPVCKSPERFSLNNDEALLFLMKEFLSSVAESISSLLYF